MEKMIEYFLVGEVMGVAVGIIGTLIALAAALIHDYNRAERKSNDNQQ